MAEDVPPVAEDGENKRTESHRDPYSTLFQLLFTAWPLHFQSQGYLKDKTMEMLDRKVCKATLERTIRDARVREAIGGDPEVWRGLCIVLQAAVPSLESRCFAPPDPEQPDRYETDSGLLIASHAKGLNEDIERLNSLVSIARNVLTTGEYAQNLAADARFDQEIFKLISVCVKVAARGFEGTAKTEEETKWQGVVILYKKLLITCLQFLNNMVARNERRKLMLWVELFESPTDGVLQQYPRDVLGKSELWPGFDEGAPLPLLSGPKSFLDPAYIWPPTDSDSSAAKGRQLPASSPFLLYISKIGMEVSRELLNRGIQPDPTLIATECKKRWTGMSEDEKATWNDMYTDLIGKYRDESVASNAWMMISDQKAGGEGNVATLARSINQLQVDVEKITRAAISEGEAATLPVWDKGTPLSLGNQDYLPITAELPEPAPVSEVDFRITCSADYGANILQHGKDDLMRRLERDPERAPPQPPKVVSLTSPIMSPGDASNPPPLEDAPEELSEEDDSEDDDYVVPGDDGRGLLTDVPLILGPSEIEVLPMIIMSGVVPPASGMPGYGTSLEEITAVRNMHTVRCHLLLAQDNGRNLLRELLIFVAAWDLREEELYFKFMIRIMESILLNCLMPFAYHTFRESKDIISPAQAVILKLLTSIFRARQSNGLTATGTQNPTRAIPPDEPGTPYPMKMDAQMVSFLFTEFRKHIIPQTCALIFLQGQIRAGAAHPEDFPLNLWDMERMYEGVYQYLEFFAVLTEHDVWKNMMAEWEITAEFVTLLKELDAAIPKGRLHIPPAPSGARRQPAQQAPPPPPVPSQPTQMAAPAPAPAPVAVERPYDVSAPALPTDPPHLPPPEPYLPPALSPPQTQPLYDPPPQEEPSDFEWRNLKKLAVLVLSSLVWKSRRVQDQVREYGGLEAILSCCNYDEHNPYIREHAIMCLRFLLEGNRENQARVGSLEPRGVVPHEVLDQHGYETFMDARGQVGLRRKDAVGVGKAPAAPQPQPQQGNGKQAKGQSQGQGQGKKEVGLVEGALKDVIKHSGQKAAADLEGLMQQVLGNMAPHIGIVGERGEALERLDREFEAKGRR
ncbi:hypothetical protein H2201_008566 [Coniosporium apollinis]|uniref:Ataxin-10 homolog n=1 Tax=Coniosporium apollinis TaxID=61459 RepID=A0ABQ9NGE2_9PEZI|nr:hypothetical protein H2201_008566 [Coniosporium apollinis]